MSYSWIVGLSFKSGTATTTGTYQNGWGSAPIVWDAVYDKYCGGSRYGYMQDLESLWPLYKDERMASCERAVLLFTYDKLFVNDSNLNRMADHIEEFLVLHPPKEGHVNHWQAIADSMRDAVGKFDAIGLNPTSVGGCHYRGDWNDDLEDFEPVNYLDKELFEEVYVVLDEVENGKEDT